MAYIKMTNSEAVALVDDDLYPMLSQYRWQELKGYARSMTFGKHVYMSRLIMDAGPKEEVDHINRNPMDNRRDNLRLVDRKQNMANTRAAVKRSKITQYRGIARTRNGKWRAQIAVPGTRSKQKITSPYFATELEAAKAYDQLAREIQGDRAVLNFP